jgi:hypothetical protein
MRLYSLLKNDTPALPGWAIVGHRPYGPGRTSRLLGITERDAIKVYLVVNMKHRPRLCYPGSGPRMSILFFSQRVLSL